MDGIGGSAKRYVWNAVKTRKVQVNNAASFTAASKTMPNVEVMELAPHDIERINKQLKLDEIYNNARPLHGIANAHCITVYGTDIHLYSTTSEKPTVHAVSQDTNQNESAAHPRKISDPAPGEGESTVLESKVSQPDTRAPCLCVFITSSQGL